MNSIYFIRVTILALLYFIAGNLSLIISQENNIATIVIFGSEGIALAAAILYGKKVWVGVFIGQFFLAYLNNIPLMPSLGVAMVNSLEVVLAVVVFKHFKFNKNLSEIQDVVGFILLIIFILQPFSATFGNLILTYFSIIEWDNYFYNAFFWWFGNIMGQLLVAPMLLLMNAHLKKEEWNYFLMVGLFFAVLSYAFLDVLPITNPLLLLAITLPLILYLSFIKGVHYGAFSTLVIALVSVYLTYIGVGVFIGKEDLEHLLNLNFYFLFQILLVLLIGTSFVEKKNKAKSLEVMVKQEVEKNREQQLYMLQRNRLVLKGEMINMIAHQWKQPLNNLSLINQMHILDYEAGELNDKTMLDFVKDSSVQIQQMSQTIADFTNFFRPEINQKEFYLSDVINQSIELLKPIFQKEKIFLILDLEENTEIKLKGYPNELGQMIMNILNNAKDALIENEIETKKVWIYGKRINDRIHFYIEDNAGGIPKPIVEKIFDPYFSTKAKNGTGLGLYMSKIIVEEHMKGQLSVSNSDRGALFEIILPLTS